MIRNTALILMLLLTPLSARAELRSYSMTHDGSSRSFRLYVPDTLGSFPGPRPLVLVLHGGGGSAREVRYSTRGRFDELAEGHGFLVLYADAIGRVWDTGSGEISSRLTPRRDDNGFLAAAIGAVAQDYRIDRSRVFATGVSRGGMESYALACDIPGLIRAIAPVAMTLPEASAAACARGAPMGFLLIHGMADPFVPYSGGPINLGRRDRDPVRSADATMAVFNRRNGCTGTVSEITGKVRHLDGTGCAVPTGFFSVGDGGHGWPGGRKVLPGGRAGPINTDISAPDEIWAFFSRF